VTLKKRSKAPALSTLRIVINDSSCLIDLRKAGLLLHMLQLPYQFVVALPLAQPEMLDINMREWSRLKSAGLEVIDLDPIQVADAVALNAAHSRLSAMDCFSLALARSYDAPVLLTGDAQLKLISERDYDLEVQNVLWVTDELTRTELLASERILECLQLWHDDPDVFLPRQMVAARIRRFTGRG
jgi:PIN domain